jgi:hypothetical protein
MVARSKSVRQKPEKTGCKFTDICPLRPSCKQTSDPWANNKPCPGYEVYANQDQIEPGEITLSAIGCDKNDVPDTENPFKMSAPKKNMVIIKLFFCDHKSIKQIAEITYYSRSYIYKTIKTHKHILYKG